ncbi:MAG TPA: metal ABC transporter substrate-binding protein [Ignavibacteriaceae bacterium]|nr:metal ABC transporter substrate-binding protein [Ignavibacteriaceae bacterium]
MKKIVLLFAFLLFEGTSFPDVKVVATTTVIYDLVKQVGGEKVTVDYLCRGDQDPHFLEVLPSYMLKIRKADIMFEIGLGLELWAPQLIDGSRNSNLKLIDLSSGINKKDVPAGKIDASQGDIHPYGNPHYWLDPNNAKIMAKEILDALADADADNFNYYNSNYEKFISRLDEKIKQWESLMSKVKGKPVIFFHASWVYFADHFGIKIGGYVEPKPGIPPTPSHNAEVINLIKKNNIKFIVMENFYSDNAPRQIASATNVKIIKVAVAPFGMEKINNYIDMMDYIINKFSENI